MRNKLDNFLLGTLWLLASALGACFWFNTQFGFDIFSGAHWRHLAYMQAAQKPVTPIFYISLVVTVLVILYVLYILLRPRTKKLSKPIYTPSPAPTQQTVKESIPQPIPQPPTVAPTNITPAQTTQTSQKLDDTTLARPPRLNIAITPTLHNIPTVPLSTPAPQSDLPEIREIFESNGYTIKKTSNIGSFKPALFAIGTNETLWIGSVNTSVQALSNAIDTLNHIFSDTLDDIFIDVHGFVINPTDNTNSDTPPNILTFDNINALRNYMDTHPNPPLPADDNGNFDAYSSYISTVIDYIGKM